MHWWWPGDRHSHGGDLNVAEIKRVAVIGAGVMGAGIADLSGYAVDPTQELAPDFFI